MLDLSDAPVLVATSSADFTSDYVIRALNDIGTPVVRVNTDRLLEDWTINWSLDNMILASDFARVSTSDVRSVYYRRAYPPQPPASIAQQAAAFVARESRVALKELYGRLSCPWISNVETIAAAENKPLQLRLATALGLRVPTTIVTSNVQTARDFINARARVVVKPLSYGDLGSGQVVHTSVLDGWLAEYGEDIACCPHLFQDFIAKTVDVRVTVVDKAIFACRIESQSNPLYRIDMRRGLSDTNMKHTLFALDEQLKARCVQLVSSLGLRFGAIDLVEDIYGQMWFLEINPNGQWAWIEDRTGAPISAAIATALTTSNGT